MFAPRWITFTGADDHTSIEGMIALARRYPIEWGILFSPKNQGTGRYPSAETIIRFAAAPLDLAGHLCGEHSRRVMAGETPVLPVDIGRFQRVQINHTAPDVDTLAKFQETAIVNACIAQSRGPEFPADDRIAWLHDQSGGRGRAPTIWPKHPGRLVGYAGGINPGNVEAVLKRIAAIGPYWIDMEAGVRTDDRFDLLLCQQICETVYPDL